MTPVDQTIFTVPGGNCYAACVASLLNMRLCDVPNFHGADDWQTALAIWLEPFDMYPVYCALHQGEAAWRPQGLYILGGKSPRGEWGHAAVAMGSKVVHDPHPSRAGVLTWDEATLLVHLDPCGSRRVALK